MNEKYLEQLIDDMKASLRKKLPEPQEEKPLRESDSFPPDLPEGMITDTVKLNLFTGISMEDIPPPEMLSELQMVRLDDYMVKILEYCGIHPVFPDGLPVSIRFGMMRKNWDCFSFSEHNVKGFYVFCDYDPEDCPFPGYCNECEEEDEEEKETFTKEELEEMYEFRKAEVRRILQREEREVYIPDIYTRCNQICPECEHRRYCVAFEAGLFCIDSDESSDEYNNMCRDALYHAGYELIVENYRREGKDKGSDLEMLKVDWKGFTAEEKGILQLSEEYMLAISGWLFDDVFNPPDTEALAIEYMKILVYNFLFIHTRLVKIFLNRRRKETVQASESENFEDVFTALDESMDGLSRIMQIDCFYEDFAFFNGKLLKEIKNCLEEMIREKENLSVSQDHKTET